MPQVCHDVTLVPHLPFPVHPCAIMSLYYRIFPSESTPVPPCHYSDLLYVWTDFLPVKGKRWPDDVATSSRCGPSRSEWASSQTRCTRLPEGHASRSEGASSQTRCTRLPEGHASRSEGASSQTRCTRLPEGQAREQSNCLPCLDQ